MTLQSCKGMLATPCGCGIITASINYVVANFRTNMPIQAILDIKAGHHQPRRTRLVR